jgi:hypothetical protein
MKFDRRNAVLGLSMALMIGAATAAPGCGGATEGSQATIPEEVQKKTDAMLKTMQKDMAAKHAAEAAAKAKARGQQKRR